MQLDRPAKRRPRPPRPQSRDSQPPPGDAFTHPADPFQSPQDPFQPRTTPPKRTASPFPRSPGETPDPFQPRFGARQTGSFAGEHPFAQTFAQTPFAQPPSTGSAPPFGRGGDPFARTAPSVQRPSDPFARKPPFARDAATFGQASFGQKGASFGQADPFDQAAPFDQPGESAASPGQSAADYKQRMPTRRQMRSVAHAKSSFDDKPATPFRGDADGGDQEPEQDSDPFQTPENERRKPQASTPNQLFLKSVPIPLFSRAALQRHFSNIPGVHVTHVSLRGSRRPDSRRTAVISFSTEQQASLALRNGQSFKGTNLQLSLFRQSGQPNEQAVSETNELFFNYVPESLFSQESITDLFDSISENGVTRVSLKEKPHYGSVKRTAVITFASANAAAMALRSLPLYKGRTLTVSFRRGRPQSNNATAAHAEEFAVENAFVKGSIGSEVQEDEELERELFTDLAGYGDMKPTGYDSASNGEDDDPSHTEMSPEEVQMPRSTATDRQAEITKLKAAILRKEKLRARMTQGDKGKRERKLMVPMRRERSKAEQEASNSGWRKVGEKVDIKNATNFVGTCMTMCPFKEFEDRIIQRDVSLFETDEEGEPAFKKAVKKYRRSAAISEQPSPDEVRPPSVLLDTMEHLKRICDSVDAKFVDIHNFVRDRTRSLRQDFTLQGVRDESCIKIHEESVRFHILSEHRLYGTDPAMFSSKQNLEQLDKCLISLREMYDIRRDNDLDTSPYEPEMQAYYILTQMSDPKTCVQLCTGFAQDVRCSRPVQFALEVVRAASEGFGSFTRYFSLVRSAPYLVACLMHSRFSAVRVRALIVINITHGNPHSRDNIPVAALARQLGFESEEEAEEFCRTLGMKIESIKLPSTDAEVVTIRTPSEGFDEAKVAEWESSRADILIESKVQGSKTSDIICGSGRNDFKSPSPVKKTSELVTKKETEAPGKKTIQFQLQTPEKTSEITGTSTDPPKFGKAVFPPTITQASTTELSMPPRQDFTSRNADLQSQGYRRKDDDPLKHPQLFPLASTFPRSSKQQGTFGYPPKPLPSIPISGYAMPTFSTARPATNTVSAKFPSVSQAEFTAPVSFCPAFSLPGSKKDVLVDKRQVPIPTEPEYRAMESSRKESPRTTGPEEKLAPRDLEKAARRTALKTLLASLVHAIEADFEIVRKTIVDARTGTLKFPKAMEVWDDAKDILLTASERTERGVRELESEDYLEMDAIHGGGADIAKLIQKLRYCSSEGAELYDELDESFSKSLAAATAHLKDSGPCASVISRGSQTPQTLTQLNAYCLEDEDSPFESRDLPDKGAEVRSILAAMTSVGLHRWQAVIAGLTCFQNDENDMGVAKRWLWQRLSTGVEQDSSSLCLLDATESGAPSVSIREIQVVSSIPYTADLIVLPCDIRTMERDPSGAWTSLEQVLRKNRSMTLSYDMPPPTILVLYYCGSSDMPVWFTGETSAKKSFATFQRRLQGKGYVSTCQTLELPRTSAFQSIEYGQLTAVMKTSIQASAQGWTRLGGVPRLTNLRDHLVHIANCALGAVLRSPSLQQDPRSSLRTIHKVNESWKDVARRLRREEARWPREMAERSQLVDSITIIETNLQLPLPSKDSLVADYIRDLATVAGVGIATTQHLDGVISFCTALGHLMNAFVRQMVIDCPVSVIYLASDPREEMCLRSGRPTSTYVINSSRTEKRDERSAPRYASRTEPPRKTKRLRDEVSPSDGYKRAKYPLRRRLSVASPDSRPEELRAPEAGANRRQSLPASYGRRRMFELVDEICGEQQAFEDMIQATMDALTAKRRLLEQRDEVLAT